MLEGDFGSLMYQENRRLRAAFSVSLLFHIGILWLLWQPLVLMRAANSGSLTVSFFTSPSPATDKAPEPVEKDNRQTLLTAETLGEHAIIASLTQPRSEASVSAVAMAAPTSKAESSTSKQPNPGFAKRVNLATGEASIVMLIDNKGRPGEIYWRELPALTDEQLHLVEFRLRRHRYEEAKRGTAVTAIINVFDILREPVRAEPAAAEPNGVSPGTGISSPAPTNE